MKLSEISRAYSNDSDVSFYENSIARYVFRPLSFLIAYVMIRLKFTPNLVTFLSIIIPLILIPFLFINSYQYFGISLLLITLVWVVLDYVDGTMARALNKKSKDGHFFDLTGAYMTFLWLYPLLGFNAYIETSRVEFFFIGAMTTALNLYPRLLNAKYLAIFDANDGAIQVTDTGGLYEKIDSLLSMRGLFIPLWIFALYSELIYVVVIFYFCYYASISLILTVKLNSKVSL